jgi:hypothetical protein
MITRTVKQVKMVEISRPDYYVDGGMGFVGNWVDGEVYYRGFYTTAEDVQQRFEQAQKSWEEERKKRWCAQGKVTVKEWWENIE